MYYVSTKTARLDRRGVILLVVLLLLTIFATLGLTLVLMTEAYATSARISREAENLTKADCDPELAFSLFMGQFLYDVDDTTGPNSALRGNSLARSMYSWDSGHNTLCDNPYSGWGRLHGPSVYGAAQDDFQLVNYQYFKNDGFVRDPERAGTRTTLTAPLTTKYVGGFNAPYTYVDENNMFLGYVKQTTSGSSVIIPSYHRPWLMSTDPKTKINPWTVASPAGKYKTLRPRSVDMGPGFPTDAETPPPLIDNAGNPNPVYDVKNLDGFPGGADSVWIDIGAPIMTTPDGVQYKMLFAPLVLELDSRINLNTHGNVSANSGTTHASNMGWGPWEVNIAKILATGEAQTIFDGTQNLQLNMPHVPGRYTNPSDRKPRGLPLQGIGNTRAWGAIDYDARDNSNKNPKLPANPNWGPVTSAVVPIPEAPFGAYWFSAIPAFPLASTYRNGVSMETTYTGQLGGVPYHPAVYNPLRPAPGNQNIPLLNMVELLRFDGTNAEALQSSLVQLAPTTLYTSPINATISSVGQITAKTPNLVTVNTVGAHGFVTGQQVTLTGVGNVTDVYNGRYTITSIGPATGPPFTNFTYNHPKTGLPGMSGGIVTNLARQQVTTDSADLGRPAAMPYVWDPTQASYQYTLTTSTATTSNPPNPGTIYTTGPYAGVGQPSPPSNPFPTQALLTGKIPANSEFLMAVARTLKVDLNRPLSSYYTMDPTGAKATAFNSAAYKQATTDRQNFAADIFSALRVATGTRNPNDTTLKPIMTPLELNAARYLAQLAVNIVDFIDQDDFNTPFEWQNNKNYSPTTQWVFGIELPRLVINEVYAQLDNDSMDTGISGNANQQKTKSATKYVQNVWVELYNPLTPETDSSLSANPKDVSAPLVVNSSTGTTINAYRLLVTQQQAQLSDHVNILNYLTNPSNQDGPDTTSQGSIGTNFSTLFAALSGSTDFPTQTVNPLPTPTQYQDPAKQNTGFLVLGSNFTNYLTSGNPAAGAPNPPTENPNIPVYQGNSYKGSTKLSNTINVTTNNDNPSMVVTLILQRLACPQMAYQPSSTKRNYNPYITVDFLPEMPIFDARHYTTSPATTSLQPLAVKSRQSYGKRQPYSSFVSFVNYTSQNQSSSITWTPTTTPKNPTAANIPNLDVGVPIGTKPGVAPSTQYSSPASNYNSQLALQNPTPPQNPPSPQQILHSFYAQNAVEIYKPNQAASQLMPLDPSTKNQTLGRIINPNATAPAQNTSPTLANQLVQFDWLVHLDRQLVSPMELLHVSAYKPAMLTQQFVTSHQGTSQAHQHVAPWLDQRTRLYRFFEFVETGPRMNGLAHSGRLPGKININLVFEPELLDALLDAQLGNNFTQAQVESIFASLLVSRNNYKPNFYTPGMPAPAANPPPQGPSTAPGNVSNGDRPFWSFGIGPGPGTPPPANGDGLSPAGVTRGIENTLLRSTGFNSTPYVPNMLPPTYLPSMRLFDPFGIGIVYAKGATIQGNVVTITTAAPHNLQAGQTVTISGVQVPNYNGTFTITSPGTPPNSTTFTYNLPNAAGLPASGGGTVTSATGPIGTSTLGTTGNPSVRYELLNKLFNNVTTRSNTFAVWVTVGFFQVTDPPGFPSTPPKLGAEVGKAEGRSIRHRMFAIVDRTNMQVWPTVQPTGGSYTNSSNGVIGKPIQSASSTAPIQVSCPGHGLASGETVWIGGVGGNLAANGQWQVTVIDPNHITLNGSVGNGAYTGGGALCLGTGITNVPISGLTLAAMKGTNPYTGNKWQVQAGSVLVFEPNTDNEDTVVVQSTAGGALFANFTRPHNAGVAVISRGNPGPWPAYNPHVDTDVVRYFAVIE